ncbi:MAG: YHS domain-containing protein [Gemmataceae bacterium]
MPRKLAGWTLLIVLGVVTTSRGDEAKPRSALAALQPFHDLIGSWRGTGVPEGPGADKQRDFWSETHAWEWRFQGDDAWLTVSVRDGKYWTQGELRYLPDQDQYQLILRTPEKKTKTYTGQLDKRVLTLDAKDAATGEVERVVISLLHSNRFLYRQERKPADRPRFVRLYQVGVTKEGVPFATGGGQPECIVSGGLGTMPVTYKGQTYYVCCGGCRDAFNDEPEKFIQEYEAKQREK